jgi:Kef-type K+ transport system membrane component KefB
MEYEFLKSLEVIFIASAAVILLLYKLKLPSLLGFIIAGIIIGPHGVGFIKDVHFIQILAEIGVILLLFTIGIEFSLTKLFRIKKAVLGGGGAQVLFTIIASAAITYVAIGDVNKSIFFGFFLYALSSTGIVLKLLVERGEIDSPHGHTMVGILIFQDLCIVPLMLLIPVLSGNGIDILDVGKKMGTAAIIIITVLLSSRWMDSPCPAPSGCPDEEPGTLSDHHYSPLSRHSASDFTFRPFPCSWSISCGAHYIRIRVCSTGNIRHIAVQGQFHGAFLCIHRNADEYRVYR